MTRPPKGKWEHVTQEKRHEKTPGGSAGMVYFLRQSNRLPYPEEGYPYRFAFPRRIPYRQEVRDERVPIL